MEDTGEEDQPVKKITLTLTGKYAATWGMWEGIREMVQNWHDGVLETKESLHLPAWTEVDVKKIQQTDCFLEEYKASARTVGDAEEVTLGSLTYDAAHHRLTLVNKNVSLPKKILLLGYSKKADTRHVIGQFGEGLKIGALSLVREGQLVTMETSSDRWQFDLAEDETFGEKVLTVFVTARSADADTVEGPSDKREIIGPDDTVTRVSLELDLWKVYARKLLLDVAHGGQLFVKGVWVSNLRDEGLATGVNLAQLQLDRDRNAVPKPSEIDHIVSSMWVKVLEQKPELAAAYYTLLQNNQSRDVRYAVDYANRETAKLVAEQFALEHGEHVFAVSNVATQQELQQIQNELRKQFVLCNSTLLELLFLSGQHIPLDKALADKRMEASSVRPYHTLLDDEKVIIQHAAALIQEVDTEFKASTMDILDTHEIKNCRPSGTRILVPYWMVSRQLTHQNGPLCPPPHEAKCMCCESRLCASILLLRRTHQTQLQPAVPPDLDHSVLHLVQLLALQGSRMGQMLCENLHKAGAQNQLNPGQVSGVPTDHRFCMEREAALQQELSRLQNELQRSKEEQCTQLEELNTRLQKAEADLIRRELSLINSESKLDAECARRLRKAEEATLAKMKKLEDQNASLDQEIIMLKQELEHSGNQLRNLRADFAHHAPVIERKTASLMEELLHYVQQCRKRTKSLQMLCKEKLEKENPGESRDKYQLLYDLSGIITEDLQDSKVLCMVCTRKRKEVVLSPCGHYQLCSDCVAQIKGRCPTCREPIAGVLKVYE